MRVIQALVHPRGNPSSLFLPVNSLRPSGNLASLADRYSVYSSYRREANRFSKQKRPSWETGDLCLGVSSRFACKSWFLLWYIFLGWETGLGSRWWRFHTVLDRNLDRWERIERVLYLSLRRHVKAGFVDRWPLLASCDQWISRLGGRILDAILVSICDQKLWKFSKSFNCVEDESFYLWRFFFFLSWERVNNSWALSWKSCRSNHNNYDVLCFMMLF